MRAMLITSNGLIGHSIVWPPMLYSSNMKSEQNGSRDRRKESRDKHKTNRMQAAHLQPRFRTLLEWLHVELLVTTAGCTKCEHEPGERPVLAARYLHV